MQPCSCRGTTAHAHVSCLFAWQLQKTRQLRDASRCEVCGTAYQVPPEAAHAWARGAPAAGELRQLRLVQLWQRARPALAGAARAAWWGATTALRLRHWWFWAGQVAYIAVEAGAVPQLRPGALPPHATRLQPFVTMAGRCLLLTALLERRTLGGVAAGTVRDAVGLAGALLALGAARTLQHVFTPTARHAGSHEPAAAAAAGLLVQGATLLAAAQATRWTAYMQALFGPLCPPWLREITQGGHALLRLWLKASAEENRLVLGALDVGFLFRARPAALAALHAALRGAKQ
ncbi:E3 ubiquitin-ligase MARCH5 [Micractinium conductrix]|uniref:E3 ubiquitin-ligase MARCH5 n=1 Tax=Micractinium conductrix TaxID=554055 RepID=A0A2P6VS92_9CHLO|nr:E3 ubiquitin-ligase MARCH5 [Micractinium conductrix]|eukprot:PSC76959.1 E3 ubiquitin-ligase MARCH5 [Micractinium conductrix]